MTGLQNLLPQKQTNKKIKAAQLRSEHDSTINKKREAQGKKERKHIDRFKLFLLRESNILHKFPCMCNTVYVHSRNRAHNL